MWFKHIFVLFVILGILGFFYGDKIFYFQAHFMMGIQYDFPAYEAYEKIIRYYPASPHITEARKMMKELRKRNWELNSYVADRDKEFETIEKNRSAKEEFR